MNERKFTAEERARRGTMAKEYSDMLRKKWERYRRLVGDDLHDLLSSMRQTNNTRIGAALTEALHDPKVKLSEWILTHMKPAFGVMLHERDREAILYWADHIREIPYTISYYRRPFRSSDPAAYADTVISMLRSFAMEWMPDLDPAKVLTRDIPEDADAYLDEMVWRTPGYNDWQIAYALDHGDTNLTEAVTRILTEDNGMGRITIQLVRGVMKSHRADLHELMGKLLLAAKLQEGLRQAICENCDCGTPEAFRVILRVIADNDLIRFSAVKRAVGVWLGIMTEETRDLDRVSGKSLRLILDCLDSPEARAEALSSEDSMAIHIALWSLAFTDVCGAVTALEHIVHTGSRHQLLVAGYFAAQLEFPLMVHGMAKTVLKTHRDKADVVAVWLSCFLDEVSSRLWDAHRFGKSSSMRGYFDSPEEAREYSDLLRALLNSFVGKEKTYSPCVFPWHEVKVSKSDFARHICTIAALTGDDAMIDGACPLIAEVDANSRRTAFTILLRRHSTPTQRRTVLEALADRETYTRADAYKYAKGMTLTPEEYAIVEGHLRFKTADIRKNCMDLLMKQDDTALTETLTRLLNVPKEESRFAALDMLSILQKDEGRKGIFDALLPRLTERSQASGLSSKEKTFLDTLLSKTATEQSAQESVLFTAADRYYPTEFDEEYTTKCAKAFGDYFPDSKLPALLTEKGGIKSALQKLKDAVTPAVACKSSIQAAMDLMSLSRFIDAHKNDEYTGYNGETALLGTQCFLFKDKDGNIPLAHLWAGWSKDNGITHGRLLRMLILYHAYRSSTSFTEQTEGIIRTVFGVGFEKGKELPHDGQMEIILTHLATALPKEDMTLLASALAAWFIRCVPDNEVVIRTHSEKTRSDLDSHAHLLFHRQLSFIYAFIKMKNDAIRDDVAHVFPLAVACAERCMDAKNALSDIPKEKLDHLGYVSIPRSPSRTLLTEGDSYYHGASYINLADIRDYLHAAHKGIITIRQLCEFALRPETIKYSLKVLSYVSSFVYEQGRQVTERHQYARRWTEQYVQGLIGTKDIPRELTEEDRSLLDFTVKVYETIVPTVVTTELKRGDSPTPYSEGVGGICRIYGAEYFVSIFMSLGKDTLDRTAYYGYGIGRDRRGSLSYLLSVCIPSAEDTVESLKTALEGKKIPKRRLIEAALFSPEWIPLMGEYLGIPSFASVCYYFMAHMNEKFDDKKRAVIARYTPLSEDELNLGAFDLAWFRSAYESIGEEDFDLIYDAAKYIADGAKHARARKYADAALGRFTVEDTEKTIADKRNKDLLMAYALIPLSGEDDLLRRYLYIQKFRKESRQFGSQRIVSEGKAVEMALKNLASCAGYADAMRLTLRMETKVIDDSRALLSPIDVEGVIFHLILDEIGKAEIIVKKDGKELKSIPGKLKKQETVLALTELKKTLTEQYRRARRMLEEAMEDQTVFTLSELSALSEHPVVYPMLKNLVLTNGTVSGFLAGDGLTNAYRDKLSLSPDTGVRIAHPFDLYEQGVWRDFQKYLYDHRITQPFRQVFRELYIKTSEEADLLHSLRYAGNQIQPAKTVATLKSRRWVADVEDGLQKVYYKENIVARIYAMADWFTPADIEAPTLEWVCFSDRRTGKDLKISEIAPVIFSEVMRDVDLAVSVAHAGGVDPETSHSTMEMRAAILSFVLPLFKLDNVRVEGRHAFITGKLADYSVHLGSGVVHQQGGAMIPVLPVHSQHRGRIFLPFADEDPKTAEIISKVLLFAEDEKIKDPMILEEIRR